MIRLCQTFALFVALCCPAGGAAANQAALAVPLGPDPYRILGVDLAEAPHLDPVPACLPSSAEGLLPVRRALEEEGATAALDALAVLRSSDGEPPRREYAVAYAILHARLEREEPTAAARRIDTAMGRAPRPDREGSPTDRASALEDAPADSPGWIACAGLERSRAWLRAGRPRHAGLNALRALQAIAAVEPLQGLYRGALFQQAESFYRDGQPERAVPIYEQIARGAAPLSDAARLRLADIAYTSNAKPEDLATIDALLARAASMGTSRASFNARRAEWALRAGDAEGALAWLEGAAPEPRSVEEDALVIRRADVLRQLGRAGEAADVVRRLGSEGQSRAVQRLAMARLFDWRPDEGNVEVDWAAGLASSEDRRVAGYVRGVRAGRYVETGDLARAIDALVRLVHDGVEAWLVPDLASDLDAALAGVVSLGSCDSVIAAMGGRRSLLMRQGSDARPFLKLADCYLELGMSGAALETSRNVAKEFGPSVVKDVALPAARAAFGAGRIADARAAAAAGAELEKSGAGSQADWRMLYAEVLLQQGEGEPAFRELAPLLMASARGTAEPEPAEPSASLDVIELGIRAARSFAVSDADLSLLRDALRATERAAASAERLALMQLALADLHRDAGANEHARQLYIEAVGAFAPGSFRARATYWLAALYPDPESSKKIWAELVVDVESPSNAWSRVAANEVELLEKRSVLGAPTDVSADRRRARPGGQE